ncbi:aminotransferase class V-fold PLP-dependent enzyme [Pedococcus bigeumensis]|uniref:Aminotransferase class V-fold PLP-dependent enzyme n=1 Tax=Pedococcus bigeumensis TaxID=433644 RepID=A0A502CVI5_9MICO|nr:aminotransferase class V-fold PLP-dependent enzyme [Pedococcus bigeumensis]
MTTLAVETIEEAQRVGFERSPPVWLEGTDPFEQPCAVPALACRVYTTADGMAGSPTVRQLAAALTQRAAAAAIQAGRMHVVTSAAEHPATTETTRLLTAAGWEVTTLAVDGAGRIDPGACSAERSPVGLGTLILAQNEVGTIQPIRDLAESLHARGAVVHTDAAQAVGKIPVDVDDLGVDLLSIAGHK